MCRSLDRRLVLSRRVLKMARLTKKEAYDLGFDHGFTMASESGSSEAPSDGWDALLINADPSLVKKKFEWEHQDSDDEAKELLAEYCKGCQAGADHACEEEEEEQSIQPAVEVCWNVEWIRENALNQHRIDEPDLEDAAIAYRSEVFSALSDCGFDVEFAKGDRRGFHQWNGAYFKTRLGCVGSFQELTKEQAEAINEALKAADEAIENWRNSDDELRELIAGYVAEYDLACPADVVDACFRAHKEGKSWRDELAEAIKNNADAEKNLGIQDGE